MEWHAAENRTSSQLVIYNKKLSGKQMHDKSYYVHGRTRHTGLTLVHSGVNKKPWNAMAPQEQLPNSQ